MHIFCLQSTRDRDTISRYKTRSSNTVQDELVAAVSPNSYYIALTKITSRIKYARKILAA
jgi:hypothetical protein